MNKPFTPPVDRAVEVSGPKPQAVAERGGNFDDDDPGMPSMAERLAQSARNMAMIAELKPRVVDEQAARERADSAVRSLLPFSLLSEDELVAIGNQARRFERGGGR